MSDRLESLRSQLLIAREAEKAALRQLREIEPAYDAARRVYERARDVRLSLAVSERELQSKPEPPAEGSHDV